MIHQFEPIENSRISLRPWHFILLWPPFTYFLLPNPPPPVVVVVLLLLIIIIIILLRLVLFLLLGDGVNLLGDRGNLFFVMVVDCNATTLVIMVDWVPFDSSSKKYVTNRPINQPTYWHGLVLEMLAHLKRTLWHTMHPMQDPDSFKPWKLLCHTMCRVS